MTTGEDHPVRGIDLERPNAARIYDYVLGGKLNYAVDRVFGDRLMATLPGAKSMAVENRKWLRRAVKFAAAQGVRQFLDIGSGMPTGGHVHEVVQAIDPKARVVYVDNEPIAVAHSEIVLDGNDYAVMVQADAEYPEDVLEHPVTEAMLDFDLPIMIVMAAFVHFIPDERDPAGLIARYRDAVVPGSYLAISSGTRERQGEEMARAAKMYEESVVRVAHRSSAELAALMDGFEILAPGVVFTPEWRPEHPNDISDHPERSATLALVGRKN